jgi:hypothetical protein
MASSFASCSAALRTFFVYFPLPSAFVCSSESLALPLPKYGASWRSVYATIAAFCASVSSFSGSSFFLVFAFLTITRINYRVKNTP